ncbi:MAG: vWA domain-containing protein [Nanoarchaeota archaeon]
MWEYCIAKPHIILLIIPLIFLLYYLINRTFVSFKTKAAEEEFIRSKTKDRYFLLVSRSIIFLLVLIALATPYTEKSVTVAGDTSLLVLADNSSSFDLFDKAIAPALVSGLKGKIPVNFKYIAANELSAIGDGILNNMKGDDNILVITDGNNNHGRVLGDVILFASSLNTSISALNLDPVKNDVGVEIVGPSQAIVSEENTFIIKINEVGSVSDYLVEVFVDGELVSSQKNAPTTDIRRSFSEGFHKIQAKITADDHFLQNNVYYKSVKIIPKPRILFISEKTSPLLIGLNEMYETDLKTTLPDDLSIYHAVIINDIKGEQLKDWIPKLTNFVSDGNGLVVIGGQSSYDQGFYQNPSYMIESLLPVRIGIPEKKGKSDVNVVILIDISGTAGLSFAGSSGNSKLDVSKALALNILGTIRPDDRVGVIAFNDVSHMVSQLSTLSEKQEDVIQKIKTLQAGGGTLLFQGLRRSEYFLDGISGSRNIIIVSDGLDAAQKAALDLTKLLSKKGIKVFTVGIGQGTNEVFLKSIADAGRGLYFKPDETQNLRILFGEEEEEAESYNLVILDNNHWITKSNLALSAIVTGHNYVVPKSGARTIVATSSGSPIVTVGSFGLGRIAAITTDDGSKWAPELLRKENSRLLTKTINYAIGEPGRNLDFDVSIGDTPINKPAQIKVISTKLPKSDLSFSKIKDNLYIAEFILDKTGFSDILGATVGVNYNDEYLNLGINPELVELVALTRGKVFEKDQIEQIAETIKTVSKRVKIDTVNYRYPFILLAFVILLLEIIIRRIKENKLNR